MEWQGWVGHVKSLHTVMQENLKEEAKHARWVLIRFCFIDRGWGMPFEAKYL